MKINIAFVPYLQFDVLWPLHDLHWIYLSNVHSKVITQVLGRGLADLKIIYETRKMKYLLMVNTSTYLLPVKYNLAEYLSLRHRLPPVDLLGVHVAAGQVTAAAARPRDRAVNQLKVQLGLAGGSAAGAGVGFDLHRGSRFNMVKGLKTPIR